MKYLKLYIFSLSCLFSFLLFFSCNGHNPNTDQTVKDLINTLNATHYRELTFNRETVDEISDIFLSTCDNNNSIFTESHLKDFKIGLDENDLLLENDLDEYLSNICEIYLRQLSDIKNWLNEEKENKWEYNKIIYNFNWNSLPRAENQNQLYDNWKEAIKSEAAYEFYTQNPNASSIDNNLLENYKNRIIDIRIKEISNLIKPGEEIFEVIEHNFLSSVARRYGPHTQLFSGSEKNFFESYSSGSSASFGIDIEMVNNNCIVSKLLPGSDAWKSGKINIGDRITKFVFPELKNFEVNPRTLTIDEIQNYLYSESVNLMKLHIIKANNLSAVVEINKEEVEIEENYIYSYILKGEKKIAYIYLPSFYSDWDDFDQRDCANDLALELYNLQNEEIDGVILDLRNNGGGSVLEAANIAGIFIKEGPLSIVEEKNRELTVIKDPTRGTVYDGPLVLLINQYSASATELLAAGLMDHKRALIIGSKTYGKSSSQIIIEFPHKLYKNSGTITDYLKVTTGKFYNLKGFSHQNTGIEPDILLPELFGSLSEREGDQDYKLENSVIDKEISLDKVDAPDISGLRNKSKERILNNRNFINLDRANNEIGKLLLISNLPMSFEDYIETMTKIDKLSEEILSSYSAKEDFYNVDNTDFDKEIMVFDQNRKKINEKRVMDISHDIYIGETYNIMIDYIKNLKRKKLKENEDE